MRDGELAAAYLNRDMKMEEIAETLGISTGAVKARLHRGRKRLREQLEEEYPGEFIHFFQ